MLYYAFLVFSAYGVAQIECAILLESISVVVAAKSYVQGFKAESGYFEIILLECI